jgi:hypothetical protein
MCNGSVVLRSVKRRRFGNPPRRGTSNKDLMVVTDDGDQSEMDCADVST